MKRFVLFFFLLFTLYSNSQIFKECTFINNDSSFIAHYLLDNKYMFLKYQLDKLGDFELSYFLVNTDLSSQIISVYISKKSRKCFMVKIETGFYDLVNDIEKLTKNAKKSAKDSWYDSKYYYNISLPNNKGFYPLLIIKKQSTKNKSESHYPTLKELKQSK